MLIAIQDIRSRLINIFLLIGLFVLNFWSMSIQLNFKDTLIHTVFNTLLITLIFGITLLYFKGIRKVESPLSSHLGLGDILFFVALTPLFMPLEYLVIFLGMTIISTIVGIVLSFSLSKFSIPHAGISAIVFIVLIGLNRLYNFNLIALFL